MGFKGFPVKVSIKETKQAGAILVICYKAEAFRNNTGLRVPMQNTAEVNNLFEYH